jgi:hypothetical protein
MELYVIEKESLNINKLEHVLIEKVEQLFRDMLSAPGFHRASKDIIAKNISRRGPD